MIQPSSRTIDQTAYCVFRRGAVWLALPAYALRRVISSQDLVAVPMSPPVLAGICHRQGEFLPVLTLDPVMNLTSRQSQRLMLVIDDLDGNWGLLVDEVKALVRLDVSNPGAISNADASSIVTGWATFDEEVVRILDYSLLREIADRELAGTPGKEIRPTISAGSQLSSS